MTDNGRVRRVEPDHGKERPFLPRLSQISDRYALLRSVAHGAGGHPAGSLQVLGGDPANADKPAPVYPDWMSVVNFLRRRPARSIPNYVSVNPVAVE